MSKKVILILVEGLTEETIFYDFLEERFHNAEIRIDVQHGDVLSDRGRNRTLNIKNRIGQLIKNYLMKYRLLPGDLLAVVHFTDADGCFIPDNHVQVAPSKTNKIKYESEAIYVVDEKKKLNIEKRNKMKSGNIKVLASSKDFMVNRTNVPYQLFYFSTNLDHLLWDEQNEVREDKLEKAEEFLENLEDSLETFLWKFVRMNLNLSFEDKMKTSWDEVTKELNSLQRGTNVPFMFEMIEQLNE